MRRPHGLDRTAGRWDPGGDGSIRRTEGFDGRNSSPHQGLVPCPVLGFERGAAPDHERVDGLSAGGG